MKSYGLKASDSPYTDEECEAIITKLEELIDGELDPHKEEEVIHMVNNCKYCFEQYKFELSLRNILKNGFSSFPFSNKLIEMIKDNISKYSKTNQN